MWSPSSRGALLTLTAALLLTGSPAAADHHPDHECDGDGNIGGGGGEAGGECVTPPPPPPNPPQECDPESEVIAYFGPHPPEQWETYIRVWEENPPPEGMTWAAAYNCADIYLGGPYLVPDPDWPDIAEVRDRARARVVPALPTPNVSPPEAVVNTPAWLWVDDPPWETDSATATDGTVTVRVDARPLQVTWDLVEDAKVCDGPGIPWSSDAQTAYEQQPADVRGRGNPACTFTFVHSSSITDDGLYHGSVTVTWEFSWWLNGVAQGTFGSVDRTTPFDLRVGEVQALITEHD